MNGMSLSLKITMSLCIWSRLRFKAQATKFKIRDWGYTAYDFNH